MRPKNESCASASQTCALTLIGVALFYLIKGEKQENANASFLSAKDYYCNFLTAYIHTLLHLVVTTGMDDNEAPASTREATCVTPLPPPAAVVAAVVVAATCVEAVPAEDDVSASVQATVCATSVEVVSAVPAQQGDDIPTAVAVPITPTYYDEATTNNGRYFASWLGGNGTILGGTNVQQLVTTLAVAALALIYSHHGDNGRGVLLLFKNFIMSQSTSPINYYLVRIIMLRSLALVYGVSFLVALRQNKALMGDKGITPCRKVLDKAHVRAQSAKRTRQRQEKPGLFGKSGLMIAEYIRDVTLWDYRGGDGHVVTTLLWLTNDRSHLNVWLDGLAVCGMCVSIVVFALGSANVPLMLTLWVCHRSLWAVGGVWYAYGWENILSEVGFYALFMVPLFDLARFNEPVAWIVMCAMRWLLFRIMFESGIVKLRGSRRWWDLTAMDYFYQSQPVPNPLSKYFHCAPPWWHRIEVMANHVIELLAPWILILPVPREWRVAGGLVQIAFQAVLILQGNLAHLNWLTAVPALACLNDDFLSVFFTHPTLTAWRDATQHQEETPVLRQLVNLSFGISAAVLSLAPIRNFFTHERVIGSFDPYQLVNVFGAFGSVSEERIELIIYSSMDGVVWKEYDFPVKPGNVHRRPRWISPYFYRLDWTLWIAAQYGSVSASSPWIHCLLGKLLEADPEVMRGLLANDPWEGKTPKYIKIDKYRYVFNTEQEEGKGRTSWTREFVEPFYPVNGRGAEGATLQSLWRHIDMFG